MKLFSKILLWAFVPALIFFSPMIYVRFAYPITPLAEMEQADAALVFGALVRENKISPLHAERLDAAIALLDQGIVESIVVSNTEKAAQVMAQYLRQSGVSEEAIELDTQAVATSDTCSYEAQRAVERRVVFISQSFHLPRLSFQCSREGITAQAFAAETYRAAGLEQTAYWRVLQIRSMRHLREIGLLWSALLGVYDDLSR